MLYCLGMVSTPIMKKVENVFGELHSEHWMSIYGSVLSQFEAMMKDAMAICDSTDLTNKVLKSPETTEDNTIFNYKRRKQRQQ